MPELISKELLAKHGITGLTDDGLRTLQAAIISTVNNRFVGKLLGALSTEEIASLQAATEAERGNRLADIAKREGLDSWMKNEIGIVIVEIARRATSAH